jgi:hypothetical protein
MWWNGDKGTLMSSERLSDVLEAEIDRLRNRWYEAARFRSRLSYACLLRSDMRKFARMVEEERDKYWHEQLLSAGTKLDQIVEEELGARK